VTTISRDGRVLACLLAAYLILALFYAWVLVNHDYEAEYLALGPLVVRGEVSLYQDEMTGQWVPLPFYVYGLSQIVFGPSLLAGRLLAVALGAVALVLLYRIAARWGGALAGAAAGALLVSNGLVMGYFSTVDYSPLVAVLHLAGIYILFCTEWRHRDLIGMAVFSLLFLVKPHYWPTIPFVLAFLLWRGRSWGARAAAAGAAVLVPVLFFLSDRRHIKIFAYVPIGRDWVARLGYHSWHSLIEDPERVWVSDYADITYETSGVRRAIQIAKSYGFFLKRYAVWILALAGLGLVNAWPGAGERDGSSRWGPPGVRFTFWLFWYLVVWQFVIVGVYIKQGFAYVGAVAPLLALVLGWLLARIWERNALPAWLRWAAVGGFALAVAVSPWVHRHHNLPRRVSLEEATIPVLRQTAARLAAVLPAGERRVFFIGDPLPIHLAGRMTYLRQFHQHNMVFTSVRDQSRYIRSGLWGAVELEEWLGTDARYAVLDEKVLDFYRSREPYRDVLARMDALLAERFTEVASVPALGGDRFVVYRRKRDTG
jgi:4-amino-4-deoxy-L-arabinose transferase-like glycosyltransferase